MNDGAVGIQILMDRSACFRKLRLAAMVSDIIGRYMSCFRHSSLRIHHTKLVKRNIYRYRIRHIFLTEAQSLQKRTEAREVTRTETNGYAKQAGARAASSADLHPICCRFL
jgi:hypothetical protein